MQQTRIFSIFTLAFMLCLLLATMIAAQDSSTAQTRERIAVVRGQGAILLAGQTQQPAATLPAGALVVVTGRSADGRFFYVQTETLSAGWIAAGSVLVVNVTGVPVVAKPTAPISNTIALSTTAVLAMTGPITANSPVLPTGEATPVTAIVNTAASRLNLRAGPGLSYPVIAKAATGSAWLATRRNPQGDWVQLHPLTGGDAAWAAVSFLQLSAVVDELPVQARVVLLPTPTPDGVAQGAVLLPTVTPPAPENVAPNVVEAGRVGKTGLAGLLVFQERIGGTIYVYDLGADTLRPLTSGIDPAISPDGRRVAYSRDGGDHGLYVINLDGADEQRIYSERELIRSPKWSPDSRLIVFSRGSGFKDCRVLTGGVCLPDDAIIEALPPDLQLPDMQVEKLIRDLPNQREYSFVLSRIGADGSDYRDVPSLVSAGAPDWGDAGIVYHSRAGIQTTADQPDVRSFQVANDPLQGYFLDPDWQPSPAGAPGRIVFHRKQGSHWQIYAVNPDGSGLAALTRPLTALVDELPSNVSPAWSPDGRTIVYLSNRSSIESAGAWHLWAMDADGTNQRRLPVDVIFDYTFSSEQMVSWAAAPGQ